MVRGIGLEPTRRKASGPKPGASTNFAIPARSQEFYSNLKIFSCFLSKNLTDLNKPLLI